jgi:xylulokinase
MDRTNLFLAIDLGTSGVKVGVIDADGWLVTKTGARYETTTPRPGWVEQDPESWWAAGRAAIKEAAREINPTQLQSLSVAGLAPALVCLNEQGEPVCPAPIWSDRRAEAELAELTERLGYDTIFSLLPRLLWLKRQEGTSYRRTRWVFQPYEYVSFKLTGEVACIAPTEQLRPWSEQDFAASELDRDKFPYRICTLGEIIGPLSPDVAAETGLPSGLPVVAGTVDTFAAWIGTATTRKGVVCNTVGTSDGIALVWDQPLPDPKGRVSAMPHITGRDWIVGGALSSGGLMLDWFVRRFYNQTPNPYEVVTQEASSVPAGAEGLMALPYLVGERSPIFNPHARGVFFGIAETHTRAHFARAVLESVAFAVRDVCEAIREVGGEIEEVRVAGGAAHSDVWSQIKADVLGRRVLIPEIADSGLLGAAIIAGWGVGQFENLSAAAEKMVRFRAKLEPNPEHHARYTQLFECYRGLYAHLKDDFARMAKLNQKSDQRTVDSENH